jgi:hypothetical protein
MTTATLQAAISEAQKLPQAAQDELARGLIERIDRLQDLRAAIALGARSLDHGTGREISIDTVISRARREHDGR